jgi:hypothetical protein
MKIRASFASIGLLLIVATSACNNYGLLDKLADPGSSSSSYYAFVSSVSTDGQLGFQVAGTPQVSSCTGTGITNADCVCQALADKQSYLAGKVYKAWLSANTGGGLVSMQCRIQGIETGTNCSFSDGPTWYNTTGEVLATGYSDLFDGTLTSALKYDEQKIGQGGSVWTGTEAGGLPAGSGSAANHCTGWTQNTGTGGTFGNVGLNSSGWSESGTTTCDTVQRIYCFAIK